MALSAKQNSFGNPTTTGNFSVTGVGFQPKAVLFWCDARLAGSADGFTSVGGANGDMPLMMALTDGSTIVTVGSADNFSGGDGFFDSTQFILNANGGTKLAATIVSLDSDGFTLNFTTVDGTNVHTIYFLALGGADLTNVKLVTSSLPASTGNQGFTGAGFAPSSVIMVGGTKGGSPGAGFSGLGWASSTTQRGTTTGNYGGSIGRYERTDHAFAIVSAAAVKYEADITSFDSDGITLNFDAATGGTTPQIAMLYLKGISAFAGSDLQGTTTGNKSTTGVGFTPRAVIFGTAMAAASTSVTTTFIGQSYGSTDGTSQCALSFADNSHGNAFRSASRCMVMMSDASAGTLAEASITSLDSSGFTVNWQSADATAREFIFFALGDSGGFVDAHGPTLRTRPPNRRVGPMAWRHNRHPHYVTPASPTTVVNTSTINFTQPQTLTYQMQTGKISSFTQAQTATVVKAVSSTKTWTQAQTLTVVKALLLAAKVFTQAQTLTVALSRLRFVTASFTQATTLTVTKQAGKISSFTQAQTLTVAKQVGAVRAFTQAQTLAVVKGVGKFGTFTQGQALTCVKGAGKAAAWTQAQALSLVKAVASTKTFTQAATLAVTKAVATTRSWTQASTLTVVLTRVHLLVVAFTQATTLTITKQAGKVATFTQASVLTITKSAGAVRSFTQAGTLTVQKAVSTSRSWTQGQLVTCVRAGGKLATFTQAQVLSATKAIATSKTFTQASSLTVTKAVAIVRAFTQASALTVVLQKVKLLTLAFTQATTLTVTKQVSAVRTFSQASSLTVTKAITQAAKLFTQGATLTVQKAASVTKACTQAAQLGVSKSAGKAAGFAQGTALALQKAVQVTRGFTQPQTLTIQVGRLVKLTVAFTQATVLTVVATPVSSLRDLILRVYPPVTGWTVARTRSGWSVAKMSTGWSAGRVRAGWHALRNVMKGWD